MTTMTTTSTSSTSSPTSTSSTSSSSTNTPSKPRVRPGIAPRKSTSKSSQSVHQITRRPPLSTTSSSGFDFPSPDRPFDDILNFRDVGRLVNQVYGKRILKEGVLFRSAMPDDASERDKQRLVDELRISSIIDLRTITEHKLATRKRRSARSLDTPDAPVMIDPDEHLLQLPGVQRHLINLQGRSFEKALLWRLSWYNFVKVLTLETSGHRLDAVRVLCTEVINPRGLIGLSQDTLEYSTAELRSLFDLLSDSTTYPTVIHCTQGKDRTGLVIFLLLLLTQVVPPSAISTDYNRSDPELEPNSAERIAEMRAVGLDDIYAKCADGFVEQMTEYMDAKYGGVERYLVDVLGVEKEKILSIRKELVI